MAENLVTYSKMMTAPAERVVNRDIASISSSCGSRKEPSDESFETSSIESENSEPSLPSVSITKAPSNDGNEMKINKTSSVDSLHAQPLHSTFKVGHHTMRRQSMVVPDLLEVKFQGKIQESSSILGKFAAPEQPDFKDLVSSVLGKSLHSRRKLLKTSPQQIEGNSIIKKSLLPDNSLLQKINESSVSSEEFRAEELEEDDDDDQEVEIKVNR